MSLLDLKVDGYCYPSGYSALVLLSLFSGMGSVQSQLSDHESAISTV